jgi:hypothetical protein
MLKSNRVKEIAFMHDGAWMDPFGISHAKLLYFFVFALILEFSRPYDQWCDFHQRTITL